MLDGVRWTLRYYLDGVPSWSWYFPYHHAPLLGDLAALLRSAPASLAAPWPPSRPLKPFEQLMAVLPPSSGLTALPPQYAELMRPETPGGSLEAVCDFVRACVAGGKLEVEVRNKCFNQRLSPQICSQP